VPLAVAATGCSGILQLDAPTLADGGTIDASFEVDVGSGDEPQGDDAPQVTDDASIDAPLQDVSVDVALDRTARDVVADAVDDVALDQASDAPPPGVLCSFNATTYCGPGIPCCETASDAGMPVLTCVPSQTDCTNASGYYIECANDNDCAKPANAICCHYGSGMRCETPLMGSGGCPGGGPDLTQACDPSNVGECPGGQSCTLHLTNGAMALPSPYWGCQ
jgi:hypothetical protein